MNINDELQELANVGGLTYAPDDHLVASLIGRTRRQRVARQSVTSAATTLGVIAIGTAAVQVYSAVQNDPAFQDRNIINNQDKLTPIELYRAKYGKENPTKDSQITVDLNAIIDKLRSITPPTTPDTKPDTKPATQPTTPGSNTTKPKETTPPPGGGGDCTDGHPPIEGATWNCDQGDYVANDGYFWFGNGHYYPTVKWTDAATGLQAWGNWSGTSYGWETKSIFLSGSGDKSYDYYVYMGSAASWSGTTCTGQSKTKLNAPVQASCMPAGMVASTGKEYFEYSGIVWIVTNAHFHWNDTSGQYEDETCPTDGWAWTGSEWVEAPEELL